MKKILSMRLLGVMAIAAIALSNVILSACSEDDDLQMNSSTLAKGLMTRAGEGSQASNYNAVINNEQFQMKFNNGSTFPLTVDIELTFNPADSSISNPTVAYSSDDYVTEEYLTASVTNYNKDRMTCKVVLNANNSPNGSGSGEKSNVRITLK